MKRIAIMNSDDRKFIFDIAANKMRINPAIVEKDFWICYILDFLFSKSKYKDVFTFKGGTSLSKAYNVINRMSEDIDLIIDWQILGISKEEPLLERSKRQQEIYNNSLNLKAQNFIANDLKEDLLSGLKNIEGLHIEVIAEEQLVNIYYPKAYDISNTGILPCVRLEIGPLAAWSPATMKSITPYISNVIPNYNILPISVRTVSIDRTFWEKVTILHREANRPMEKKMPHRYARHYYDVYMIYKSPYFDSLVSNYDLLNKVTKFKIKFYNDNWAKYEELLSGIIKVVPPEYRLQELENDYKSMKEMLGTDAPDFAEILSSIEELEKILNKK